MSAQLDKIGENGKGYGHLEKVYSIWICLDNIPRKLENTISYYKMQNYKNEGIKDKEFRIDSWESDLLEIIIVRLGGEGQEEKGLLDLLYGLFSGNQKKVLSYIPDSDNQVRQKEVSVAEFIPQEVINLLYCNTKFIFFHVLCSFADHCI